MKGVITIKLGGSLLYEEDMGLRLSVIDDLAKVVEGLLDQYRVFLVVGGGRVTRSYSTMLRDRLNKAELDQISIEFSRIHTFIVARMLGALDPHLVTDYHEIMRSPHYPLYVTGGFYPGQSTNGTAALVAEMTGSSLLFNLLSFDGVHDSDPVKHGEPRLLKRIGYDEFKGLVSHFKQEPGHYELFDHTALRIVQRSRIPVRFINGNRMESIADILNGGDHGTLLHSDR